MKNSKDGNIHKNHRQRMRERFNATGFKGWSKHEILEYMLYNVYRQGDTNPIAHRILEYSADSFVNMFNNCADMRMAEDVDGVGESAVLFLRSLKSFIDYYRLEEINDKPIKADPQNILELSRIMGFLPDREDIMMLCLDYKMNIKSIVNITEKRDMMSAASSADTIIRTATINGADNVILVHNHPDGSKEVSFDDIKTTMKADTMLSNIGINLVDHFIISDNDVISIKVECFSLSHGEEPEL